MLVIGMDGWLQCWVAFAHRAGVVELDDKSSWLVDGAAKIKVRS